MLHTSISKMSVNYVSFMRKLHAENYNDTRLQKVLLAIKLYTQFEKTMIILYVLNTRLSRLLKH